MSFNKDIWIATIATLSLMASVIIPFASRKYDQWKAKVSFDLYLKKYLGVAYNILTYDKIEYHEPSIKDNPEKLLLNLSEYVNRFSKDFKEYQFTLQPRIGFTVLMNLQYFLLTMYRIKAAIEEANVSKLYEQTLTSGSNLSKQELNAIYGILLLMEHFGSILNFHDRFKDMKVVKRLMEEGKWVGLKVEAELLNNQHLVANELKHVCNEEVSMNELILNVRLIIQEFKKFYGYERLELKRLKSNARSVSR